MDEDDDGLISLSEYLEAHSLRLDAQSNQAIEEIFQVFLIFEESIYSSSKKAILHKKKREFLFGKCWNFESMKNKKKQKKKGIW